jgi:hypothetical protein
MIALLQRADSQASAGICGGAQAKVQEAEGVLATLPKSVDPKLRRELANGMERLRTLIANQCQRPQPSTTDTTPTDTTPTDTTPTDTTPTDTTPTDTTPTDTTPTDTTPTDTTPTDTTPTDTTPTTTGTTPTTTTGTGGTPPPPANGATVNGGQG